MFGMLKQLWFALSTIFGATTKGANALDNILTMAEEASEKLLIEGRLERKAQLKKLQQEYQLSDEDLKELSTVERRKLD